MEKRSIKFGDYDTADYGWTLTSCVLGPAELKTNYVEKVGGDGSWDLSTALTDNIPKYKDRPLTVTLELSEGDRPSRERVIKEFINTLHGRRVDIHLPDDPYDHLNGRLSINREYNDLAHAAVTVAAVCDPWKYLNHEVTATVSATSAGQAAELLNEGIRVLVPTITVTGDVIIIFGTASMAFSAGRYQWPDLLLAPGSNELTVKGTGSVTFKYREAVLE